MENERAWLESSLNCCKQAITVIENPPQPPWVEVNECNGDFSPTDRTYVRGAIDPSEATGVFSGSLQ
jgi:hypothetical protein